MKTSNRLPVAALAVIAAAAPAPFAQQYNLVELDRWLGPVKQSWATDVSDAGAVVGQLVSEDGLRTLGFAWSRGLHEPLLPQPSDPAAVPPHLADPFHHMGATAVNEDGVVVGTGLEIESTSSTPSALFADLRGESSAAGYVQSHAVHDPAMRSPTRATDVSTSSPLVVVGYRRFYGDDPTIQRMRGFVSVVDEALGATTSTLVEIGTFGGDFSRVWAVDDAGAIAGEAEAANLRARAFFADAYGQLVDLGTLGGEASAALDLAESGDVVGWAENAAGDEHAFLLRDGVMHDLGTLGGPTSRALGVASDGSTVVGTSTDADGRPRAFAYVDGALQDLNDRIAPDSGWILTEAVAVNAHGAIVGSGVAPDGSLQAFLLEPAALSASALEPSEAGQVNSVHVDGLAPDALALFLVAADEPGYVPLPDAHVGLLLGEPLPLGLAHADDSGRATLELFVPLAAQGLDYRLQAFAPTAGAVSDVRAGRMR